VNALGARVTQGVPINNALSGLCLKTPKWSRNVYNIHIDEFDKVAVDKLDNHYRPVQLYNLRGNDHRDQGVGCRVV